MTDDILTVTTAVVAERVSVLTATGEIDRDSHGRLRAAADEAIRRGQHRLVLDLTGVTFCDSAGLSLFVDLHRATQGLAGEFRLACAREMVSSVIRATNLDRLLLLHPTLEDAVRAATRD